MAVGRHATLDAHARPPESLRVLFKTMQKLSLPAINRNSLILDFNEPDSIAAHSTQLALAADLSSQQDAKDFFVGKPSSSATQPRAFEVKSCPGLLVFPGMFSEDVQATLLDKIMHRDLSNPDHLTNVHLFHEMTYPQNLASMSEDHESPARSFFTMDLDIKLRPKDPSVHRAMSIDQLLRRKLRWLTLGGQYDWTNKVYPSDEPPPFPEDTARLLRGLFPSVDPQAAIVNLYSPGDTLSVHRDVSEDCERDLISISIGCDALFLVGNMDGSKSAVIRLRSGDAVLMSGPSRYAWHGVPKVVSDTCPNGLAQWPASATATPGLERWRGWLRTKRINLNVRQMKEVL